MTQTSANSADWRRLLKGAFAFQTAPFAIHPNDERRAVAAIAEAIRNGATKSDIEAEIQAYLAAKGCAAAFVAHQLSLFRRYFRALYSEMKNCWILTRPNGSNQEFVAIFSGRRSLDDILYHCMYIYQSRELNESTQFMRAKKKRWPTFRIDFFKFENGGLWEGRASIGYEPSYQLVRADALLSKGLDPASIVMWTPKPIPPDPGPTWHGLRYQS